VTRRRKETPTLSTGGDGRERPEICGGGPIIRTDDARAATDGHWMTSLCISSRWHYGRLLLSVGVDPCLRRSKRLCGVESVAAR
jgi:hypothetical protein